VGQWAHHLPLPLLAQSGHADTLNRCPLLGVKRTSQLLSRMSANDPLRTSAVQFCCDAHIAIAWNGPKPSGVLGAVGPKRAFENHREE
jgi:hypothetical protein